MACSQSGNGKNLTQTNISLQPQIINDGVIETENGRPFIKWIASRSLNLAADMTTNGQVFVVNKFGTPTNADGFLLGHSGAYYWHAYPALYGNDKLFTTNGWTSGSIINGSVWQNGTSIAAASAIYNRTLMVNDVQPQTATARGGVPGDANAAASLFCCTNAPGFPDGSPPIPPSLALSPSGRRWHNWPRYQNCRR